jgi:hypothetical protein
VRGFFDVHRPHFTEEEQNQFLFKIIQYVERQVVLVDALEDASYHCVDNLPPELLASFVALEQQHRKNRIAIVIDVRSAASLADVPAQLNSLRAQASILTYIYYIVYIFFIFKRIKKSSNPRFYATNYLGLYAPHFSYISL